MRTPAQRAAWRRLSPNTKRYIRSQPISEWAKRVKREFSYECAQCKSPDNLEAHHIYFKSLYPTRIQDLDNGCCLCLRCHDVIHSLYIQSPDAYYDLINLLSKKRIFMKSISFKKRNPSQEPYPDIYINLPIEDTATEPELSEERMPYKKSKEAKGMPYKKTKKTGTEPDEVKPKRKRVKPPKVSDSPEAQPVIKLPKSKPSTKRVVKTKPK